MSSVSANRKISAPSANNKPSCYSLTTAMQSSSNSSHAHRHPPSHQMYRHPQRRPSRYFPSRATWPQRGAYATSTFSRFWTASNPRHLPDSNSATFACSYRGMCIWPQPLPTSPTAAMTSYVSHNSMDVLGAGKITGLNLGERSRHMFVSLRATLVFLGVAAPTSQREAASSPLPRALERRPLVSIDYPPDTCV